MTRPDRPGAGLPAALPGNALLCADYAALIAAARASVAAADSGSADPLIYVRDLLAARGHLPQHGASPLIVLADARAALHMTGWTAPCPRPAPRPDWPRTDARPVLEIASAVDRPGPDDPTPPVAAPCGYLSIPAPGSTGGRGAVRHASSCAVHPADHDGLPQRLARAALYEITLDGMPESAGLARGWAARILDGCPAADGTILAVSELVTNAVLHSRSAGVPGSVHVRLVIAPGAWLRCEIRDAGPARPATVHDDARPFAPESDRTGYAELTEHGHGIPITRALTWLYGTDSAGLAWFAMHWRTSARPWPARNAPIARQEVPASA